MLYFHSNLKAGHDVNLKAVYNAVKDTGQKRDERKNMAILDILFKLSFYKERNHIKWDLYIPMIITFLFSLYGIFYFFKPTSIDFRAFYETGKEIFSDPTSIYKGLPPFIYLPAAAMLFAPLSTLAYQDAQLIFLICLFISAELSLVFLWKILKYRNVDPTMTCLILMSISGGYTLLAMLDLLQTKHIVLFLLTFVLEREITKEEKTLKFFAGQALILNIAISFLPYLIFPAIIYILHKNEGFFTLKQIFKYLIFTAFFLLLNSMFFLNPELILDFWNRGTGIYGECNWWFRSGLPSRILGEIDTFFSIPNEKIDTIITVISLSIITIYLSIKDEKIEKKMGLYFLLFLIFSTIYYATGHYAVLLPMVALLFTDTNRYNVASIFLIGLLYYGAHAWTFVYKYVVPIAVFVFRTNLLYIIMLIYYFLQKNKEGKDFNYTFLSILIMTFFYILVGPISYTIDTALCLTYLGISLFILEKRIENPLNTSFLLYFTSIGILILRYFFLNFI